MVRVEEEKAEPVVKDPLRTGLRGNPGRRDDASHGLQFDPAKIGPISRRD
jgi:hypothetical protein